MRKLLPAKSLPIGNASASKFSLNPSKSDLPVVKRFALVIAFVACSPIAIAQSESALPSVDRILDRFVLALGGQAGLGECNLDDLYRCSYYP